MTLYYSIRSLRQLAVLPKSLWFTITITTRNIETIRLAQDNPSDIYRINVDGMPIEQSQNIKLAPNDSLFLFIEVTINPNNQNTPFLVNNQLEFTTNGKTQLIDLVAFGQNANFYTPC